MEETYPLGKKREQTRTPNGLTALRSAHALQRSTNLKITACFCILLASASLAWADDVTPPARSSPTPLPSTEPSPIVSGSSYEYRRSPATGGLTTPPSQLIITNKGGFAWHIGQPLATTTLTASAETSPNNSGDLSSQLAQGIMSEEAEGNLPGAMSQYEKLIIQFDQSRAAAANALFRLAEGHRKLGQNEEAKIAYSRVLREFPDFEELASLSHKGFIACAKTAPTRRDLDPAPLNESSAPKGFSTDPTRRSDPNTLSATQNYTQLNSLYLSLRELNSSELLKVLPTAFPDEALSQLLQDRRKAEQSLAQALNDYGEEHSTVKNLRTTLKTIEVQLTERMSGVLRGLDLRVKSAKAALDPTTTATDKPESPVSPPSSPSIFVPLVLTGDESGQVWQIGDQGMRLNVKGSLEDKAKNYLSRNPPGSLEVHLRKSPQTSKEEVDAAVASLRKLGAAKVSIVDVVPGLQGMIGSLCVQTDSAVVNLYYTQYCIDQIQRADPRRLQPVGADDNWLKAGLYATLLEEYQRAVVADDGSAQGTAQVQACLSKLERYKTNILLRDLTRNRDESSKRLVQVVAELSKYLAQEQAAQAHQPATATAK